ncbi:MAG: response regulator [Anaerolineales bacterium]|nr:response regulator [Anaerolineales bacterium]
MIDRIKVLIVEDEFLAAMLLSKNLERFFGYEICGPVATGEEAIETAGIERPHVVLMDIRLASAMSGIEAAREIKSRYNIPPVFVTGYSISDYIMQCQELEPMAFLEKPLDPPKVDAAIKLVLTQIQ